LANYLCIEYIVSTRTVARKSSIGKLYVCAGGLDIQKFDEIPLIYSVSYLNLGEAWFEGAKRILLRRDWFAPICSIPRVFSQFYMQLIFCFLVFVFFVAFLLFRTFSHEKT